MFTPFILSGPSGVGKNTVLKHLRVLCPTLAISLSTTTREPREGEVRDIDYRFVTADTFERLRLANEFLEYAEYGRNMYGTRLAESEKILLKQDLLFEVECEGAAQIRNKLVGVVSFFLIPPSFTELERRLRTRDASLPEEEIRKRLERSMTELQRAHEFDFCIVNDDPNRAAAEIQRYISLHRRIELHSCNNPH